MNHGKGFISIFDGLGDDRALNISSVNEIIFIGPVSTADDGLSDKARHMDAVFFGIDRKQSCRNLPSVNMIKNVF